MRVAGMVALLVGLSMLPAGGAARASCAAPYLTLGEVALSAGSPLSVEGRAFVEGCDDTGGGDAFGCSTDEGEQELPMEGVLLEVRQAGRTWELAEQDAGLAEDNKLGQITWDVVLPGTLRQGPATLLASVDGTVLAKQTVQVGVLRPEE